MWWATIPAAAFGAAAERFGAATQLPGAMDQVFDLPFGTMTGRTVLRFIAFDLLIHSWDLATTLGTTLDVPDDVVAEIADFAHLLLDGWTRDGINFGEEVPAPEGGGPLEQLVAFSGRTVA